MEVMPCGANSREFTILRVKRCLRKKNRVLFRSHSKLIVKSVMPNFLHIIPVTHNSMLNRIYMMDGYRAKRKKVVTLQSASHPVLHLIARQPLRLL
ncbi:hypothetical protein IEQ34_019694 [Dendrobium chrysotoxum]|uniref:Uncharacterized protein n=1 Tax=Dendrobium chrysotoxum TaxID=161865 RepID=A0AAV7G8C4_DENCH|nr:hypothetical protein IEQ34_019694 [Dendrobium chrysotoxum]